VRPGTEVELQHRHALDRLRVDVLDAVDVEEVVLVEGDDLPLHLARGQPSEWLHNVEHGHSEVREDVYGRAPEGKEGRENEREDRHHHGERSAKCTSHNTHQSRRNAVSVSLKLVTPDLSAASGPAGI